MDRRDTVSEQTTAAGRVRNRRLFLGEILVAQGVITKDQLQEALGRQKSEKGRLGKLLVDFGVATEHQICEAVSQQLNIPSADMTAVDIPNDVLSRVSRDVVVKHLCLPWFVEGRELYVIMADP